jgi:hypothetical protein
MFASCLVKLTKEVIATAVNISVALRTIFPKIVAPNANDYGSLSKILDWMKPF